MLEFLSSTRGEGMTACSRGQKKNNSQECRPGTSHKQRVWTENTKRTMGSHIVQPLEVPAASVSRRANIVHWCAELGNVVGQDKAGRQEAGDKHLADLNKTREARWRRNILIFQMSRFSRDLWQEVLPWWLQCREPDCHTPPGPTWHRCSAE